MDGRFGRLFGLQAHKPRTDGEKTKTFEQIYRKKKRKNTKVLLHPLFKAKQKTKTTATYNEMITRKCERLTPDFRGQSVINISQKWGLHRKH